LKGEKADIYLPQERPAFTANPPHAMKKLASAMAHAELRRGHASIGISARYVHPSADAVLEAMSRLGGHKIEHSKTGLPQLPSAKVAPKALN